MSDNEGETNVQHNQEEQTHEEENQNAGGNEEEKQNAGDEEEDKNQDGDKPAEDEDKELEGIEQVPSLNALVEQINSCQKGWDKLYNPVKKAKAGILKDAKLDKVKGSNLKHVMQGFPLYIIAT